MTNITTYKKALFSNSYPGRTIIIGMTPKGSDFVQVYWIMGRSLNSRNRIFEIEGDFIRNKAFNPDSLIDPSLIIYYPIRHFQQYHVVSNGDHTETIIEGLKNNVTIENSLFQRQFEPDEPHYTPRISGLIDTESNTYNLSILKSLNHDPSVCIRNTFNYSDFNKGKGHCIHTYDSEENSILKSFNGEPFEVPLYNTIDETAEYFWSQINTENKISLLVKHINVSNNIIQYKLLNKNLGH